MLFQVMLFMGIVFPNMRLGVFGTQIEFLRILQFLYLIDTDIFDDIIYIFKNILDYGR